MVWNKILRFGKTKIPTVMATLACLLYASGAKADSTIFGGGPFYAGGTATMNALRASGYTTVMLWCIHVDSATGNLIYNDQLVVANGAYVGNAAWPSQLATLKVQPTSVKRIEVSVGSWGVNDFLSVRNLMDQYGTNTGSILYRNFKALKTATGADAIDFDDEVLYDATSTVKFARMLSSIGYKITLCPYNQAAFWQSVYNQLGSGIVDAVYLQCYAGGAGNNPVTWNGYFPGLKVQPGLWCKNGSGCSSGNSAAEVESMMSAWRTSAGIPGGFMWLYDDMLACTSGGTAADYARAINRAVDPLSVTPSAGFQTLASFNREAIAASSTFTLVNGSATAIDWSIINTSAWLTVLSPAGTLPAYGSVQAVVNLNSTVATNLAPALYTASVIFSNRTSGATLAREFRLNTAVANWPVTLGGFNASIIAPATATAANPGATAFDIPNSWTLYQAGVSGTTRGLPPSGIFSSLTDNNTAFQLGPYGGMNALMLSTNLRSGTLTLQQPQAYNSLAVLATSANGGGLGTMVVNFSNGTKSQDFSFNAQDWFYVVTNVAIQGFGRLKLGATLTAEDNGNSNPNLYQTTINLAALGLTQAVSSVTFTFPSNGSGQQTTAIFAISGMPMNSPLFAPANLAAVPGTNATVRLTWSPSAGALQYRVKRSLASGSGFEAVGLTSQTNYTDTGLANGSTYYYVVTAVGAASESGNSREVVAAPGSYLGWLLAGTPVAYWPLDESAGPIARELIRGSNGVSSGSYIAGIYGAVGAGFSTPHRAIRYSGAGYTEIPRLSGSTNFTIAFWVQTTASGGGTPWYNGQGIVDGEVGGTVNDFGIALCGAKIAFGIGNPDTTLLSVAPVNNGLWHFVTVTRDSGTGMMRVYVDGAPDSSMTGPTGPRTAPASLHIGSLQTGGNFFTGSVSDMAFYDRVLTPEQVNTLYRAATGLYYDITVTSTLQNGNLVLNWPGNGKLLEATNVVGPWTTNNLPSPVSIPVTAPQKFFKVRTF